MGHLRLSLCALQLRPSKRPTCWDQSRFWRYEAVPSWHSVERAKCGLLSLGTCVSWHCPSSSRNPCRTLISEFRPSEHLPITRPLRYGLRQRWCRDPLNILSPVKIGEIFLFDCRDCDESLIRARLEPALSK